MRRLSFALFLVLAATGVACTADSADDELGSAEGEKRIKPKDSEALARLQVNWPQGWQAPVNPGTDATVTYRGSGVVVGTASRLKDGAGCVTLRTPSISSSNECNITLTKNKTTTVELSAIRLGYDLSAQGKLAVDFGPRPLLAIKRMATNDGGQQVEEALLNQAPGQAVPTPLNGKDTRGTVVLPGEYRFSWTLPILDEVKENVAKGKVEQISLDPSERRTTIVIKAPTRELPNASFGCTGANRNFIVQRKLENPNNAYGEPDGYTQRHYQEGSAPNYNANEGIVAWRSLPLNQDTTIRVFPFTAAEGAMHYEYIVNGVVVPIDAKPGKTVTIPIERLDVDHVEVEKEDGTTYDVQGTYKVYRQAQNNTWLPISWKQSQYSDCSGYSSNAEATMNTGTGIDLPPGTYRVVINYQTAEGSKVKDETVTLP